MRPPFVFVLFLFPLIVTFVYLLNENQHLADLEQRFASAARKEKVAKQRRDRKDRFVDRYADADPYFLDRRIETLSLLENEKTQLQALNHHPAFPNCEILNQRLAFLRENRLAFVEEHIRSSSDIKETDEKQRHSAQVDEEDLKKILCLIEDVSVGNYHPEHRKPQMIVKNLKLKKLKTSLETEVFELEMDLLKREFLK